MIRTFNKNYCNVIYIVTHALINFGLLIIRMILLINLFLIHKIKSISTFDFSTLYTSLPQDLLIESAKTLLEKPFTKNNFLITNCFNTYWSNNSTCPKSYYCFDKITFFESIKFLVNNSYITFGSKVFHQVIGIPMGSNCSPLLADLFLFNCEYNFVNSLNINDLCFSKHY